MLRNRIRIPTMLRKVLSRRSETVSAHCDGPCGVYDPAQARVTAEAVLSMTKKLLALKKPTPNEGHAHQEYLNTFMRYVKIKEEQAQETKEHLLILWTDYFKAEHLKTIPELHELFWRATKLCSRCKVSIDLAAAEELLATVKNGHELFWKTKGKNVAWVTAS